MILLISCFITHDRSVNTCNRLDLFKHTLKSYSRIDWDDIYLLVQLDEEFKPREKELKKFIKKIFSKNKVVYIPERYEYQWQWKQLIKKITNNNNVVWFTQNDDHPFIDINLKVLYEGVDLLLKDNGKYSSIYFSHWTEILRLSGKFCNPKIVGNYVMFQATIFDSIQMFNTEYLKYIFLHLNWRGKQFKRIDSLLLFDEFKPALHAICGFENTSGQPDSANLYLDYIPDKRCAGLKSLRNSPIQNVYVPLREFCRKYSGYSHVNMEWVKPLELSNDNSFNIKRPPFDDLNIINTMTANHKSAWTFNNKFNIPQQWINKSLSLYKQKSDINLVDKNFNFKILEKIELFIKTRFLRKNKKIRLNVK
jgi:hypothetical protein